MNATERAAWLAEGERLEAERKGWQWALREWWAAGPPDRGELAQAPERAGPTTPDARVVRLKPPGGM
jgi:hypothetical protein